jgi:hypothetical protein
MYWKITPYHNSDADICIMPGDTEEEHREALDYAKERLEESWDILIPGKSATVVIECCEGEMPEGEIPDED